MYRSKPLFVLISLLLIGMIACEGPENPNESIPVHGQLTGLPAIDAITKDIVKNPNNPALYYTRCEAYTREEMYAEAVKDAEKLLSFDSTAWKAYRILAGAYLDNDESKRAIKTLEKGLEIHPENRNLLLVHSEICHILKQYDEGMLSAEKILKQNKLDVEGLFMKGLILKENGDTMQAINTFQTAVEQDANHLPSYIELALLFYKLRQPIAVDYYTNALRIDSTNYTALKGLAQYYHQNGFLEDAKKAYERTIYHHPQEAETSYDYGLLYMELKDYEKAHNFFNVATKYNPQFGEAYYFKGLASEKMGKMKDAIRSYKNAEANKDRGGRATQALNRLNVK